MSESDRLPVENRTTLALDPSADAQRALKNFRYIVGAVNDDALKVWADILQELQQGATPGGTAAPSIAPGFTPSCGWSEFLEKFWLMKHYLDYLRRLSRPAL